MPLRFVLLAALIPALAVQAQTFTDVSDLLPDEVQSGQFGGGAIVDADGDGRTDLAATNTLLLRREGGFEPVPLGGPIPLGSVYGDVDGDALLDVLVLYAEEPEVLRYNRARQALTPFAGGGLGVEVPLVQGSILFDYDRDGLLDALISDDGGLDRLYRGLGGGAFEEVSDLLPRIERGDYGMMAADYDRDGDADVYVGLCVGNTRNLLYRYEDTGFTEAAAEAAIDDNRSSWGVTWLDFDNDGWLDVFVANMPPNGGVLRGENGLFRNNGDGTFTDVAESAGVDGAARENSWTAASADFDNDGWLDLFLINDPEPSRLYRNNGDGTFSNITSAAGLPILTGLPLAVGDVNDDGWPDLYVPGNAGEDALFYNDGGTNAWLTIDLTGVSSNADGIGARVEVTAGGLSMVREITAGDGFMAHSHGLRAHFGLGIATSADVTVRWPSGAVETIEDVAANQFITVVEGLGINQPPAMFGLTSPADGAVVPLGEAVTLAWDAATDPESGAVGYTVYLAAPDGTDQTFETAEPTLTVPASALTAEGTYRWAVVASDGHTPRTSLDPFRFTNNPDVATEAVPEKPAVSLEVWPNPVGESATVRFGMAESEAVSLEVFDALGRRVRNLDLGVKEAGVHTERVDMAELGTGVYLLSLTGTASGRVTTRLVRASR